MNPQNFFAELRRRNVYKVAVAYVVVGWLLLQAASIFFPAFEAPPWVMKVFIVVIFLGFPAALVLAWAFEITPQGIKRAEDVAPNESITLHTGRKLVGITIALAVLAASLLALRFLHPKSASRSGLPGAMPASAEAPVAVPEKSIAVLPFENLSEEKANAFFASGIQDEILTRLAKIRELKVISRTSTQQYQSKPESLTQIAKQLGVANILEGSVQRAGNAVHINVQLIEAATDAHLWAESYDRELKNIFGVEGEVAGAIADALKATLSGAEEKAITAKPTQNAAAYEAYLHGISLENTGDDVESFRKAVPLYNEAVLLDPKFAFAWARLAIARSHLYFNGIEPAANSAAAVKEAADQAIALQPESGEAFVAEGVYRYRVLRDFPSALQSFQQAFKRLPNSSLVLAEMAHLERRLGQSKAAEEHYLAAAQLDPRNLNVLATVADVFQSLRRFQEAEAMFDRILEICPGNESTLARKASLFQAEGRLDESAKVLNKISPTSRDDAVILARTFQLLDERRFEAAAVECQKSSDLRTIVLLGYCQEWAGRESEARATFTRAVAALKPSPASIVPVDARTLPSFLAWAYAGLGDKEKALAQAQRGVADYQNDILAKPFAEQVLAQIQAHFGDLDSAMAALPHLLKVPNGLTVGELRLSPIWDPLRKDPRFQKLVAEDTALPAPAQTKP